MLRLFSLVRPVAVAALAAMILPAAAQAQSQADEYAGPPVGADTAYDYITGAHFTHYDGLGPQDWRAREQLGYRDGVLPIAPRTSYYAGVSIHPIYDYGYYGYGYGYGWDSCGCRHYDRRYIEYYDDYGHRGDSYRGYGHYRHYDDAPAWHYR